MERVQHYRISDLKDTTKKIRIISFYDNSLIFYGDYKDVPPLFMRWSYTIFCPKKDCFEFMV